MKPSSAKAKGRTWENEIVGALIEAGWPHAERRRLAGALDRGDIAGVPGVVIEAKNRAAISLAAFVDEAESEAAHDARDRIGVAWIKRKGKPRAVDGYVAMTGATFVQLLIEAGYSPTT